LNLLIAVVFTQRPFPDDFHFHATLIQFVPRFESSCVDGFPKLMGGSLGDNRDGVSFFSGMQLAG
jgi:hypothetical protein